MNKTFKSVEQNGAQLELGFGGRQTMLQDQPRRTGRQLAAWWFERMREAVDRASEWSPAPQPRPEQIWLSNTHRSMNAELACR